MRAIGVFLLLLLVVATVTAQPVYESRDAAGPVFSDSSSVGARELVLPPLDDPAPPPPATSSALPRLPVTEPYTVLNIVAPDDGGTIHSNTGQFTVQVAIQPDLQSQRGDAIAVSLDQTVLSTTRRVLQFDITPSEWEAAAGDNAEHQLSVAVVNRSGEVLVSSAPVRFYVHRASVATHPK